MFFVTKNFMFVTKSFFGDFRHLELNFERNRDQECRKVETFFEALVSGNFVTKKFMFVTTFRIEV